LELWPKYREEEGDVVECFSFFEIWWPKYVGEEGDAMGFLL
jgi:hypothetical protein